MATYRSCFPFSPLGSHLGAESAEKKFLILSSSFVGGLACAEAMAAMLPLGPRAAHMAAHILLINAVAPALARAWLRCGAVHEQSFAAGRMLLCAAAAQLILLWMWHAPGAIAFSSSHVIAHAFMSTLLLGASLAFWLAVLGEDGSTRWRGIFGLAATGKLSCLLGALLLFAPRVLDLDNSLAATDPEAALLDQRLAGLLMLAACPLCYVLTGVKIAFDWLRELETHALRPPPCALHGPPRS